MDKIIPVPLPLPMCNFLKQRAEITQTLNEAMAIVLVSSSHKGMTAAAALAGKLAALVSVMEELSLRVREAIDDDDHDNEPNLDASKTTGRSFVRPGGKPWAQLLAGLDDRPVAVDTDEFDIVNMEEYRDKDPKDLIDPMDEEQCEDDEPTKDDSASRLLEYLRDIEGTTRLQDVPARHLLKEISELARKAIEGHD